MEQEIKSPKNVILNKETGMKKEENDEQIEGARKVNYSVYSQKEKFVMKIDENDEKFEVQFKKHCEAATKAKDNYLRAYKNMMSKLSAEQLEPIAESLREHEGKELQNLEKLADKISIKLYEEMSKALESFWDEYDVDSSIASLEMLKDQFKEYEGTDWQMCSKTIAERVRPKQMHMKKLKQVYLERQMKYQNKRLKKLMQTNKYWRTRLRNISNQRCYLHSEITKRTDSFKEGIQDMKKVTSELLDLMI